MTVIPEILVNRFNRCPIDIGSSGNDIPVD
jgi:hypothetical protein